MNKKQGYYKNKKRCAMRKKKKKGLIFIFKKIFSLKNIAIVLAILSLLTVKYQRNEVSNLKLDIANKQNLITSFDEEKNALITDKQNLQETVNQLQLDNQSLSGQIEELNSQIDKLTDDNKSTSNKLEKAESTISTYKKEIDTLKKNEVSSRSGSSISEVKNENSDDLDLMSRIIYAEAGNCSDEEQLLVGNVIMNRVASSKYPNTIRGVIYQKGQYSPTWNGAINKKPSEQAIKNAKRILAGERFCPSNVVYQAMFKQGSGVYKALKNPDGTTYFCYA